MDEYQTNEPNGNHDTAAIVSIQKYDIGYIKINTVNNYKLFGTTVNTLIKDGILKKPNYIKIDVDGNEDLILKNSEIILNDVELKEMLVEINEEYTSQFSSIIEIMKKHNFKIKSKHISEYALSSKFKNCYNYIFTR